MWWFIYRFWGWWQQKTEKFRALRKIKLNWQRILGRMNFLPVTRYSLLFTRYSLLLTRYSLLFTRYILLFTRYYFVVTRYYFLAFHSLVVTAYSLLFILLFIRHYLFVTHYFLLVIFTISTISSLISTIYLLNFGSWMMLRTLI